MSDPEIDPGAGAAGFGVTPSGPGPRWLWGLDWASVDTFPTALVRSVAASGASFVGRKISGGLPQTGPDGKVTGGPDAGAMVDCAAIAQSGMYVLGYHVLSFVTDPRKQAQLFAAQLKAACVPFVGVFLDVEDDCLGWQRLSLVERANVVLAFLEEFHRITGWICGIYCGESSTYDQFGKVFPTLEGMRTPNLWIADYRRIPEPGMPLPWKQGPGFTFWQRGGMPVNGYHGLVDYSIFRGTPTELAGLAERFS